MTFVVAYSSGVLNAVITQTTMGSTDTNAPNISVMYFKTERTILFTFAFDIIVHLLWLPLPDVFYAF